ncbi:unnamed protein product, partial [Rodentolepis nana]|uniref:SWIRM domain-containing protein n=1 Tax=Rodentolepis nana TaxID=102285 RepID=A0A0R3SZY3_RODNA
DGNSGSFFHVQNDKYQQDLQSSFNNNPLTSIVRVADEEQNRKELYELFVEEKNPPVKLTDKLTFCAEMPDEGSYGRAFWRVKYTCNFLNFQNEWQEIEKYLPKMSSKARANLKLTTGILMQKYYTDDKSLRKGDRIPFHSNNNENKSLNTDSDEFKFVCLRVPRRHAQMVLDLAKYWCEHGLNQPVIVVPPSKSSGGDIISLVNHPSFLCSWENPGPNFGIYYLPNFKHFFINKVTKDDKTELILNFPMKDELSVLMPNGKMCSLEEDTLINPKRKDDPFQSILLPRFLTTPIQMDAVTSILNDVLKCLGNEESEDYEQE